MKSVREDFNSSIEKTVLREECSHARQSVWKKNSEATFEINGKVLKKQEKDASKKVSKKKPKKKAAKSVSSESSSSSESSAGSSISSGQQQQQQQQHLFASQFAYNIPQQFNQPNHFHSSQPQYANPVAPSMFSHQQHFNTHQQYAPQYIQQIEQPAVADRSRLSFISKQIEQPPHPFLSSSSSFSPSFSSQSKPIVTKVVAESESDDEETKEYPDN